jgi:predicted RNA-binding Zn-ribbon protein involved in translation (DUF1610 family)
MILRPDGRLPVDVHECVAGGMPLSPRLEGKLTAKIESTPFESLAGEGLIETSTPWFCPRCGKRMLTHDPRSLERVCVNCSLILEQRLIYELVEIHPHKNSAGGWS